MGMSTPTVVMAALLSAAWARAVDCHSETLTVDALAARRGVSPEQFAGLRGLGFTVETLCDARDAIIAKGLDRLTAGPQGPRPDGPAEYPKWRNLSLRDEHGDTGRKD